MFEKASRMKLRFNYRGQAAVEDLWDVPLTALDSIFKELNAKMKTQKEESLMENKSREDETLELQIGIIKHIYTVRDLERKARADARLKAELKQRLLGIKAEKEDMALRNMTDEELDKKLAELA